MRDPTPSEIGAASALATMGALPIGLPPEPAEGEPPAPPPIAYALGAVSGAALGGGLVGLVAAGDMRGAFTGALLTGGLASVADGLMLVRRGEGTRTVGSVLGVVGLAVVAGSLFLAAKRRGEE